MKIESIEPVRLAVVNVPELELQRMRAEFLAGSRSPGMVIWYRPTDTGFADAGDEREDLEAAWEEATKSAGDVQMTRKTIPARVAIRCDRCNHWITDLPNKIFGSEPAKLGNDLKEDKDFDYDFCDPCMHVIVAAINYGMNLKAETGRKEE